MGIIVPATVDVLQVGNTYDISQASLELSGQTAKGKGKVIGETFYVFQVKDVSVELNAKHPNLEVREH